MRVREIDIVSALANGPRSIPALAAHLGENPQLLESRVDDLATRGVVYRTAGGRVWLAPGLGFDDLGLSSVTPPSMESWLFDEVDSTNDIASDKLDGTERVLVVAHRQRGGRGRRNRAWASPPGGIWASIGDARPLPASTAWVEPYAMALAATEAVRAVGIPASVAWPNDVVDQTGAKLGGILVTTRVAGDRRTKTVCGIGLNANVAEDAIPDRAASIRGAVGRVDRLALLGHIVAAYERYREHPADTRRRWIHRSATIGNRVHVSLADTSVDGTAVDITESGDLVVDRGTDTTTISPGECRRCRHIDALLD